MMKGNLIRLWKVHTSYDGSDEGKEDVLLVADADLLVVHLDQSDIIKVKPLLRELGWETISINSRYWTCIMQWSPEKKQKSAIAAVATTAQIPPIHMYTAEKIV